MFGKLSRAGAASGNFARPARANGASGDDPGVERTTPKISGSSLAAAQRIARLGNFDYEVERDVARWSDELYRIFGFSPQQFVPTYKSFLGSVHPDDRQSI